MGNKTNKNCRECGYVKYVTPSAWCEHPLNDRLPRKLRNISEAFMMSRCSTYCPLQGVGDLIIPIKEAIRLLFI